MTTKPWWPSDFGFPSTSGSLEELRYAYFPAQQRLLIERGGKTDMYDLKDYQFRGVLKLDGPDGSLSFLSQKGRVALHDLSVIQ